MSHLVRQLERFLKVVQSILQFPLHPQEDAGVAHRPRHSILVTRLLEYPECLRVDLSRGSEVSFLDRNHTEVKQFSRLTLLIADGLRYRKCLPVQLLGRSEIPLINGDFS